MEDHSRSPSASTFLLVYEKRETGSSVLQLSKVDWIGSAGKGFGDVVVVVVVVVMDERKILKMRMERTVGRWGDDTDNDSSSNLSWISRPSVSGSTPVRTAIAVEHLDD